MSKRLNIGLQFFADEAANADTVVDAVSEVPATPETAQTATNSALPTVNEPMAELNAQTAEPQKEITETKAFAKRLSEMTTKAKDELIAEIYGDSGIKTFAEYQAAKAEQEAAKKAAEQNIPVEIFKELQSTKSTAQQALDKLAQYERKEAMTKEAEKLSNDEAWGDFYKANKDEIHALAEEGNVSLDVAKLLVLDKKGFPKVDEAKLKEQAVKEYLEGIKKGNKPVEGNGPTPVVVPSAPKTFAEARQNSLAMLRANQQT